MERERHRFRNKIVKLGVELYGEPDDTGYLRKGSITTEEAERIWKARPTSSDAQELKRADLQANIIGLLNYFEYICAAYMAGAVDQKIIKVSFKAVMTRWYKALKNFIDYADDKRQARTWPPYCDVMEQWIQQPQPEPPDNRFIDPGAAINAQEVGSGK